MLTLHTPVVTELFGPKFNWRIMYDVFSWEKEKSVEDSVIRNKESKNSATPTFQILPSCITKIKTVWGANILPYWLQEMEIQFI